jgi:hypothetical protein
MTFKHRSAAIAATVVLGSGGLGCAALAVMLSAAGRSATASAYDSNVAGSAAFPVANLQGRPPFVSLRVSLRDLQLPGSAGVAVTS